METDPKRIKLILSALLEIRPFFSECRSFAAFSSWPNILRFCSFFHKKMKEKKGPKFLPLLCMTFLGLLTGPLHYSVATWNLTQPRGKTVPERDGGAEKEVDEEDHFTQIRARKQKAQRGWYSRTGRTFLLSHLIERQKCIPPLSSLYLGSNFQGRNFLVLSKCSAMEWATEEPHGSLIFACVLSHYLRL